MNGADLTELPFPGLPGFARVAATGYAIRGLDGFVKGYPPRMVLALIIDSYL